MWCLVSPVCRSGYAFILQLFFCWLLCMVLVRPRTCWSTRAPNMQLNELNSEWSVRRFLIICACIGAIIEIDFQIILILYMDTVWLFFSSYSQIYLLTWTVNRDSITYAYDIVLHAYTCIIGTSTPFSVHSYWLHIYLCSHDFVPIKFKIIQYLFTCYLYFIFEYLIYFHISGIMILMQHTPVLWHHKWVVGSLVII